MNTQVNESINGVTYVPKDQAQVFTGDVKIVALQRGC